MGGGDEFGKKLKNEQIIEIYQEIRKQTVMGCQKLSWDAKNYQGMPKTVMGCQKPVVGCRRPVP